MTPANLARASVDVIVTGQAPSGAFIAGPTFSQYGYAWLRDGAFIAEALDLIGCHSESARFHAWVASVVERSAGGIERSIAAAQAGRRPDPADYLHCRYRPDGSIGPDEWPTFQLDGARDLALGPSGRHASATGRAPVRANSPTPRWLGGRLPWRRSGPLPFNKWGGKRGLEEVLK